MKLNRTAILSTFAVCFLLSVTGLAAAPVDETPAQAEPETQVTVPLLVELETGVTATPWTLGLEHLNEFVVFGACNGGQCTPIGGGPALSCGSSGGPDCGAGETCICSCEGGGGQTSTRNQCIELAPF